MEELCKDSSFEIDALYKAMDFEGPLCNQLDRLVESGVRGYIVPTALFSMLSSTQTPQGVLAIVRRKTEDIRDLLLRLTQAARQTKKDPIVCVLAQLRDPGNAGTILRTADALAVSAVLCTKGTVDLYAPKTVRASMGSIFHLPFAQTELSFSDLCRLLKENGFTISASSGYGTLPLPQAKFEGPTALVIGNEANGLSQDELKLADQSVYIPMPGQAESFNAAIAAGILLYQVTQNHTPNRKS